MRLPYVPVFAKPTCFRRKRSSLDRKTAIIEISSISYDSSNLHIVAGMGAGADDFLAKPFHRDELNVRLRAGRRITNMSRELNESNRRMKGSFEAAARIQRSYLPKSNPKLGNVESAWHYQPCEELGGDMLNIVRLDEQHVGMYVLDVDGHGGAGFAPCDNIEPTDVSGARSEFSSL